MSNRQVVGEIRGVLIPLLGLRLLLPNAAVAEIIDYSPPAAGRDQPDWLLGMIKWRQRNLPVIRFETLLGQASEDSGVRRRLAVCHALTADARRPYMGLVTQGIPRLVRVREELLEPMPGDDLAGLPVHARVRVNGEEALIPDLDRLEDLLAAAM